ncbi:hypothetical protein TNCV_4111751 [Trichonephila clavipes]|nr:hypothetical protein TNCV_4111751 [Trichonephila clavipes]
MVLSSPCQYGGYGPRLVTEWVRVRIPTARFLLTPICVSQNDDQVTQHMRKYTTSTLNLCESGFKLSIQLRKRLPRFRDQENTVTTVSEVETRTYDGDSRSLNIVIIT